MAGQIFNADGIKFPATQVPSSNANILDDYEEGTWTPVCNRSEGAITAVYEAQVGKYTKIGNVVIASAIVTITSVSAQGTGNARITGLPYNPADNYLGAGSVSRNTALDTGVANSCSVWSNGDVNFFAPVNSASEIAVDWKQGYLIFTLIYFV